MAGEPIHRGGGQIIPTARRVAYSAFLMVRITFSYRVLKRQISIILYVILYLNKPTMVVNSNHVIHISIKEMIPIVVAAAIWGRVMEKQLSA